MIQNLSNFPPLNSSILSNTLTVRTGNNGFVPYINGPAHYNIMEDINKSGFSRYQIYEQRIEHDDYFDKYATSSLLMKRWSNAIR